MRILHILNKFDSLESIAKKYNVSYEKLMESNNIVVGDPLPKELQIPILNADFVVVNNLQRDFLLNNCNPKKFNDIKLNLQKLGFETNNDINVNQNKVLFTKKNGNVYVVGVCESLDSICKKFSVNKEDVINKNNLKTEKLFIGQMLNLWFMLTKI